MQNRISTLLGASCLLFSAAALSAGVSFSELDVNADGAIDQGEAAKSAVLAPLFSGADSNSDGRLDQDEFSTLANSSQDSPQESNTEEAE
ncbi:MAG: EF-hand domain-containing protein [Gammaproteobacteria bacterium]|nr:EF-hand domain-containing protein [Gammaproteobacteria bacterium]